MDVPADDAGASTGTAAKRPKINQEFPFGTESYLS
jgi:hypothetical protein